MKLKTLVLLLILPATLPAQRSHEEVQKLHQDSKAYIAMLESPERIAEQKPDEVIKALGIKSGETIVDIGAGSGLFSFRFSPAVGPGGHVYAVDVSPDMIRYMNRQIRERKLKNVVTVLCETDDPLLPDIPVDRFFICNTWHHIGNRPEYLVRMGKMLKPGGQIVVLDYKKEELPVGPPPKMKISKEEVMKEMEAGGFRLSREHTFLPYQYFLIFSR